MRKKLMIAGIVMLTFFMPIFNLVKAGQFDYICEDYPLDKTMQFKVGLECIIASLVVSLIYIEIFLIINYILKVKGKKTLNKYFIFKLSLIITIINLLVALFYFKEAHYIVGSNLGPTTLQSNFRYVLEDIENIKFCTIVYIIVIMIVIMIFLLNRKRKKLINDLTIILFVICVYCIIRICATIPIGYFLYWETYEPIRLLS